MIDIDLAIGLGIVVLIGAIVLVVLELLDSNPPEWVVKFRMWMNRRKRMKKPPMTQTQVGLILILVLLIGMAVASVVAGIVAMGTLHPLPGRIA